MHKLNFCGTLCLPKAVGKYETRGMNIVHSFEEAHVIPMAGIATPLHCLYVPKPILPNSEKGKDSEILNPKDLEEVKEYFSRALAPDCGLDPSPLADVIFNKTEDSLKYMAEQAFNDGHESVVIWMNNGIGVESDGKTNGVLRNKDGIAEECIVKGERFDQYQKGISETYQNSAHAHIHFAPTTRENGFDKSLISSLGSLHKKKIEAGLNEYREMIREDSGLLPCISAVVIDSKDTLENDLKFTHYPAQYSLAGLARTLVTNHSNLVNGIDFKDKETKKAYLTETGDFYKRVL